MEAREATEWTGRRRRIHGARAAIAPMGTREAACRPLTLRVLGLRYSPSGASGAAAVLRLLAPGERAARCGGDGAPGVPAWAGAAAACGSAPGAWRATAGGSRRWVEESRELGGWSAGSGAERGRR